MSETKNVPLFSLIRVRGGLVFFLQGVRHFVLRIFPKTVQNASSLLSTLLRNQLYGVYRTPVRTVLTGTAADNVDG